MADRELSEGAWTIWNGCIHNARGGMCLACIESVLDRVRAAPRSDAATVSPAVLRLVEAVRAMLDGMIDPVSDLELPPANSDVDKVRAALAAVVREIGGGK